MQEQEKALQAKRARAGTEFTYRSILFMILLAGIGILTLAPAEVATLPTAAQRARATQNMQLALLCLSIFATLHIALWSRNNNRNRLFNQPTNNPAAPTDSKNNDKHGPTP